MREKSSLQSLQFLYTFMMAQERLLNKVNNDLVFEFLFKIYKALDKNSIPISLLIKYKIFIKITYEYE